jgi:hypothetical protein
MSIRYVRVFQPEQRRHELQVIGNPMLQFSEHCFALLGKPLGPLPFLLQPINGEMETLNQGNADSGDGDEKHERKQLGCIECEGVYGPKKKIPGS